MIANFHLTLIMLLATLWNLKIHNNRQTITRIAKIDLCFTLSEVNKVQKMY